LGREPTNNDHQNKGYHVSTSQCFPWRISALLALPPGRCPLPQPAIMRGRVPATPPEQLLHASADSDLAARIGAAVGADELGQHALGIDDLGKLGAVPHPLLTAEQRQRHLDPLTRFHPGEHRPRARSTWLPGARSDPGRRAETVTLAPPSPFA